jgi:hypothetical protein
VVWPYKGGTLVAKQKPDKKGRLKGKSGQARDYGEWKLWGRRPLTFDKAGGGSFGGTELTFARSRRAIIARLLIGVLKGLGGASQEDQQPALFSG